MAINNRILYVDKLSTILSPTATPFSPDGLDPQSLLAWCVAKGITGIKWYAIDLTTAEKTSLRTLIELFRNNGIRDHQFVESGSPAGSIFPASGYDSTATDRKSVV